MSKKARCVLPVFLAVGLSTAIFPFTNVTLACVGVALFVALALAIASDLRKTDES